MVGLGQGHRSVGIIGPGGEVQALQQPFNEVVFGQPDSLVCAHTIIAEVLLAIQAVGGSRVALVARAALRLPEVVSPEEATMGVAEPPAIGFVLLLGGNHHVQQIVEEKIRRWQRVHSGLGDGDFLVTSWAPKF